MTVTVGTSVGLGAGNGKVGHGATPALCIAFNAERAASPALAVVVHDVVSTERYPRNSKMDICASVNSTASISGSGNTKSPFAGVRDTGGCQPNAECLRWWL